MSTGSNVVGNVFDSSVQTTADGSVVIDGDLTVSGTTTSIETVNLKVEDKLIELGNGTAGTPSGDGGIILERGSSTNASLIWDESDDTWVVSTTSATGSSSGDLTLTDAALKAAAITASGDISTTGEIKTAKVSYTDGDDAITIADGGGITANTSLTLASGSTVTAIKDEDNLASDSATSLATQQSIKAYVDSTVTAQDLDITVDGGSAIAIDLDSEALNFVSGEGVDVSTSGNDVTVACEESTAANKGVVIVAGGTGASVGYSSGTATVNVDAAQTGITSVKNTGLVVGRDADNDIDFGTDNNIIFRAAGADQVVLKDGVLEPVTDADVDLGASAKQFKDGYFHGTLEADAITVGGANLTTIYSPIAGSSSIVTTGALNAGSITSGFTSIDVGAGAISTTGTVTTGVVNSTVTAATGVSIDQNFSVTDASTTVGLDIDFDKTGASTSDNTMIGLNLDMDNTTATNGTNTMVGAKLTPTLQHASAAGTTLVKGIEITATGSGPGNTTTRAIDLTATGADFNQGIFMKIDDGGPDIKMLSSADNGDFCTIATGANGALTITTTDDDGANADINLVPDGEVVVTGTLQATAFKVGSDSLAEVIQDTVGAMVGSNTETGITVSYEDSDGTLDFVLAAVGTNAISDDAVTVAKIEDLARGNIIYGNASAETAKLAPGSNGQVLTSDGTDISWQNAAAGGATLDLNLILHTQVFGR